MATKNNINTFYFKLFGQSPNPHEYAVLKSIANENIEDFSRMVATNFNMFQMYSKWRDRYYNKLNYHKLPDELIYNIEESNDIFSYSINKNSSPVEKIKYFFLKYDKQILSEEELEDKKRLFINHLIPLLDNILFDNKEDYIDYFLQLK
jgi:hypothetical protein